MSEEASIDIVPTRANATRGPLARIARRLVFEKLEGLERGRLTLVEGDRLHRFPRRPAAPGPEAIVEIRDPEALVRTLLGGTLGFAEAYIDGQVAISDVLPLARLFIANRDAMDAMDGGLSRLRAPADAIYHALNRNSKKGSLRNIASHYDLGNEFFRLFLDETMMYSCAIYPRPDASLHEAQLHRLDRICEKLELSEEDHLLEIGTGWGGLAVHAASRFGCRVTTTTISREQHALATARVQRAGLEDRVEVLLQDYRDLEGRYDKLVSIEMIEAVGHHFFDTFFEKCASLLEPEGSFLLQSITIDDRYYESARDSVDFMKRHIFPGCCIPAVSVLASSALCTDMNLHSLEEIGPHYASTLSEWRRRFHDSRDALLEMGFDEGFIRAWDWYLASSEAGFAERLLGNAFFLFTKPAFRREGLPEPTPTHGEG